MMFISEEGFPFLKSPELGGANLMSQCQGLFIRRARLQRELAQSSQAPHKGPQGLLDIVHIDMGHATPLVM